MDYMTTKEAGEKWGITSRRVMILCKEDRIDGVAYIGGIWLIPKDAEKPTDARIKSGKYLGQHKSKNVESDQ